MKTILVVDDDEDIRETLLEFYGSLGYGTCGAGNGREGLDRLRACHASLVLLDLMMPVMSGWEFMDARRGDPELEQAPVVAFTASGRPPPAGCVEVIRKPGDLDSLAHVAEVYAGAP